jgi:hypothetical protein
MANEAFEEREQLLGYAARLQGLSLLRTGDTFALAEYKLADATLDEIAAFLIADRSPVIDNRRAEEHRRADLRALLKAERALLAEFEQGRRSAGQRGADHESTEAALADIRRRMAEIQQANLAPSVGIGPTTGRVDETPAITELPGTATTDERQRTAEIK